MDGVEALIMLTAFIIGLVAGMFAMAYSVIGGESDKDMAIKRLIEENRLLKKQLIETQGKYQILLKRQTKQSELDVVG